MLYAAWVNPSGRIRIDTQWLLELFAARRTDPGTLNELMRLLPKRDRWMEAHRSLRPVSKFDNRLEI
jgi:hypothetical protein